MRHHAPGDARHFGVEDVVLLDEEIRAGAVRHHVSGAARHFGVEDVVRLDEGTRAGWQ